MAVGAERRGNNFHYFWGLMTLSIVSILPTEFNPTYFLSKKVNPTSESFGFASFGGYPKMEIRSSHKPPFRSFSPHFFQNPLKILQMLFEQSEWKQPASRQGIKSSPFISSTASVILLSLPLCEMSHTIHQRGHFSAGIYAHYGSEGGWALKTCLFFRFWKNQGRQMCAINRLPERDKTSVYTPVFTGTQSDEWRRR